MCLGLAPFPAVRPIFRDSTIVLNFFNSLNSFNSKLPLTSFTPLTPLTPKIPPPARHCIKGEGLLP